MADSTVAPILITGIFTLAGSLGGSAVTLYAASRRDRQLDRQAGLARNLELRRSVITEFVLAYDEVTSLATRGRSARAQYQNSEQSAEAVNDLRRRLDAGRTSLELLGRAETQPAVYKAQQLAADVCAQLSARTPGSTSTLDELATAMTEHKKLLIDALRIEIGELS